MYDIIYIHYTHLHMHISYIYMYILSYIYINIYIVTSIDESAYRAPAYLGGEETAKKFISHSFFLGTPLMADPGHWHNFAHNIDKLKP